MQTIQQGTKLITEQKSDASGIYRIGATIELLKRIIWYQELVHYQ